MTRHRASEEMCIPGAISFPSENRLFGFTLIELLVSMAVLALMLVLLLQVVDGTFQSTRMVNRKLDASQDARRALDVMANDIRNSVIASESTILAGVSPDSPSLAMVTRGRGPVGSKPRFLAVNYSLNSDGTNRTLQRVYGGVSWANTNLLQASVDLPAAKSVLANGVLGLNVCAVLEDGTRVIVTEPGDGRWATNNFGGQSLPPGFNALISHTSQIGNQSNRPRVRNLEITVASIDDQSRLLLASLGKLDAVHLVGKTNAATSWTTDVINLDVPSSVQQSIRVLSKTVEMP